MHRFRKKSDAKRSPQLDILNDSDSLPELPPVSNFRTSLILPDLTRRFTLLRTSSGNPISLDDLRTRFAEQRARGAEIQVSQEEEDMILETIGRIRGNNAGRVAGDNPIQSSDADHTSNDHNSTNNVTSAPGSVTSFSPGRFTKRYSNNLFGSARFKDDTYIRSVQSQKTGSPRTPSSTTLTDCSLEGNGSSSDGVGTTTPDDSTIINSSSVQLSPEHGTTPHSAPPTVLSDHPVSVAEYRLSRVLGSSVFKRASLALEEAIKEMEEEAEDEIVMPRTRTEQDHPPVDANESVEAGTAISSEQLVSEGEVLESSPVPQGRPGSTSPTPRLPGYIPGMPRPMTPRDIASDSEDQSRPHSTTPRATSPSSTDHSSSTVPRLSSGLLRRDSNATTSRYSPRPTSPFYLPKSPDGSFLLDDHLRFGESFSSEFDSALNSSIRRRPSSPLSGPTYQPMAVSARPGTPSNITWNTPASPQKQGGQGGNGMGHSRDGSWVSENSINSDIHGMSSRLKSTSRSLRSPSLPDSPMIERSHESISRSWNPTFDSDDNRPTSITSGVDPGSNRIIRSPTPTSNTTRSPTSPTFPNYDMSHNSSPRTSKQNAPSSPFSFPPSQPLVFSPVANSSRSSLESAGSSYHSGDGHHKDRVLNLFNEIESSQSIWHEGIATDNSSSATPGDSQYDSWDAEAVIGRFAGLTKSDFMAIQEKLVGAAFAKTVTPDNRDRAPSLRRRRPSTSQSNYSLNGREAKVVSPLPHILNTTSPISPSHNADKTSKASALLDSVVDSIQSPRSQTIPIVQNERTAFSQESGSPTSRRNRDLTQALFGMQDRKAPPAKLSLSQSTATPAVIVESTEPIGNSSSPESINSISEHTESRLTSPRTHNPSEQKTPKTPVDQADLAREVQRKADAAMLALRRPPSQSKPERTGGSISRRRVSPGQISNPRLVSASTSVDTIPLRSPSVASGNVQVKPSISQRVKRLRGTLRGKPIPQGEEVTPYPLDYSPAPSQTAYYDPASLQVPGEPSIVSATEVGRFRVSVPSPPASAGPGLKGFMARFRKSRIPDAQPEQENLKVPTSPYTPSPLSPPAPQTFTPTATQFSPTFETSHSPIPSHYPPPSPVHVGNVENAEMPPNIPGTNGVDDATLRQYFNTASNLGLDQAASKDLLNIILAHQSTDLSVLTKNNLPTTNVRQDVFDGNVPDRVRSPTLSERRPSMDSTRADETVARKPPVESTRRPRNPQDDGTAAFNAIVRRTIIYPSESKSSTLDLNLLMRKSSQSKRHRRSASVASISSRSVVDRVPTPPPPRSPSGKRFSADSSPPVPQLPPSLSSYATNLLIPQSAPAGPIEKSSSTYDSLYEMYSGENKPATLAGFDPQGAQQAPQRATDGTTGSEGGPALEVIEMANGETIWSIVNGLRDDDTESFYGSRTSFASEYSVREPNGSNNDGMQVFVKEHGAKGGGNPTFLSRKKSQTKSRPETKVFYSSSAQIGRLIENLSQGMEAGSFNFLPEGHPHASSVHSEELHWTVEERLDHMLHSMGSN